MRDVSIRSVRDADSESLIALIDGVFAEYEGCVLEVDTDMPELRAPAAAMRADDGRWWIAEIGGALVGSVALAPAGAGEVELRRLYVAATARRRGLGARLVGLAESEAARRDADSIFLWTDTRFADAHRLYERLGYSRRPGERALHDASHTVEYHYAKELRR